MQTIPDKVWTSVVNRIKRDRVTLVVSEYQGQPELLLMHHVGYGEYESPTIMDYVERVTEYEYEEENYCLSSAQLTDLEDILIDQTAVKVAKMDEYLIYSAKLRKANNA